MPITVHAQVASVEDSCVQSSGGRCDDNLRNASVQEILNICQAIPPTDLLLRFGQTPAISTSHLWWFGGCPSLPENAVHSHTFQYSAYVSVVCRFVRRLMPCFPFMAIAIASNELLRRMEFPVANGSWLLLVPLSCSRSGWSGRPCSRQAPFFHLPAQSSWRLVRDLCTQRKLEMVFRYSRLTWSQARCSHPGYGLARSACSCLFPHVSLCARCAAQEAGSHCQ